MHYEIYSGNREKMSDYMVLGTIRGPTFTTTHPLPIPDEAGKLDVS
jgi:hypothetical protein